MDAGRSFCRIIKFVYGFVADNFAFIKARENNFNESGKKGIGHAGIVEYRDNVYIFHDGNDCGQTEFGCALQNK